MSDIFISYSSNRDRIVPLVNALERTGWSVSWDRTNREHLQEEKRIPSEVEQARKESPAAPQHALERQDVSGC